MDTEVVKPVRLKYTPTERQMQAHICDSKYILYGGAMGGGKSVWLSMSAIKHCLEYEGARVLMARFTLKDFKATTLVTLLKFLPSEMLDEQYGHNKQEREVRFNNGSIIKYTGLADEDGIKTLKSFEMSMFCIDEANEIMKDVFEVAKTRLRWVLPSGKRPIYKGLLTSNPEDCWLKDTFVDGRGSNCAFVQALPKDNIYLPEDYKDAFVDMPDEWRKRYWEGSWDDFAEGNFVIEREDVFRAVGREIVIEDFPVLGIDVARGIGGDETVHCIGLGGYMDEMYTSVTDKTDQTSIRAQGYINTRHIQRTCIDDIGIGAGVTDMLGGFLGLEGIEGINVGMRSDDERFFNMRAELWWNARVMFREGKVSIKDDRKMVRQLQAVKYKTRGNGKIMIEPKEETKKRLGESPDRADALVLMLWAARGGAKDSTDYSRLRSDNFVNDYGWDVFDEAIPNTNEWVAH